MPPSKFKVPLISPGSGTSSLSSSQSSSDDTDDVPKKETAPETGGPAKKKQKTKHNTSDSSENKTKKMQSKKNDEKNLEKENLSPNGVVKGGNSEQNNTGHQPSNSSPVKMLNPNSAGAAKQKPNEEAKHPTVPKADSFYERIFDAVLVETENTETVNPANQDESQDMFGFSQSDLDDSEDEALETANETGLLAEETETKNLAQQEQLILQKAASHDQNDNQNDGDKRSAAPNSSFNSQVTSDVPPSPCVLFMCNSSQLQKEKTQEKSDVADENNNEKSCAQKLGSISQSEIVDKVGLGLGQCKEEPKTQNEEIIRPQQSSSELVSFFEPFVQPTPPQLLTSPQKNKSAATASQSPPRHLKASVQKTPSVPRTPTSDQRQSSSIQGTPQMQKIRSVQGTPTILTPTVQGTPKVQKTSTAKKPSSVQGTPTLQKTVSAEEMSCSQNTPTNSRKSGSLFGSQPLTQDYQLSQPPPQMTAKERLLWLRERRAVGLWVQCDECQKWRYLPDCHDPTSLPDKWYCRMHPDAEFQNCNIPEKRLSLHAEEDMIYNSYNVGSLVWAKVTGYPWWPAIVDDDPDLELFYWLDAMSDIPTWYHVVFFGKEPSRAWVQTERLKPFKDKICEEMAEEGDMPQGKKLKAACKKAQEASALDLADRLERHSFVSCFKGNVGGSSRRKYEGDLGFRKAIKTTEPKRQEEED